MSEMAQAKTLSPYRQGSLSGIEDAFLKGAKFPPVSEKPFRSYFTKRLHYYAPEHHGKHWELCTDEGCMKVKHWGKFGNNAFSGKTETFVLGIDEPWDNEYWTIDADATVNGTDCDEANYFIQRLLGNVLSISDSFGMEQIKKIISAFHGIGNDIVTLAKNKTIYYADVLKFIGCIIFYIAWHDITINNVKCFREHLFDIYFHKKSQISCKCVEKVGNIQYFWFDIVCINKYIYIIYILYCEIYVNIYIYIYIVSGING